MPLPPVSVLLPVHRAVPALLRGAFESIRRQTHAAVEILVVLNGADHATADLGKSVVSCDPRARLMTLPEGGLSAALNAGLREARHALVARMDADDECAPTRLALQASFLLQRTTVAVVGTAFESIDESNQKTGVEHPPTAPGEVRWRLALGNCFCHGSVMMRKEAALGAGGYDGSMPYGQDYDLWLRLSRGHDRANLPEVLYRRRASLEKRHEEEAAGAAAVMLRHWSTL